MNKERITIQNYDRPKIYEKGTNNIWTDSYISRQMLAAHLDPEFDGASRKKDFIDKSAAWLEKQFPVADFAKVIDFGCGPGLYAERLAQMNYTVTGIDFSKGSIEYARNSAVEHDLSITYIQADYLIWQPSEPYDLALLVYCDYGALDEEGRRKILNTIHAALKKGGQLLLDNFTLHDTEGFSPQQTWTYVEESDFWSESEHVLLSRTEKYGNDVTLEQTILICEETIDIFNIWKYYSEKQSLCEELEVAGFVVKNIYQDVTGADFSEESRTIAVVAEKM